MGGIASFIGLVRAEHGGETVTAMTLEHYPGMTERKLAEAEAEACRRWPLLDVLVIHRYGRMLPGEPTAPNWCSKPGSCTVGVSAGAGCRDSGAWAVPAGGVLGAASPWAWDAGSRPDNDNNADSRKCIVRQDLRRSRFPGPSGAAGLSGPVRGARRGSWR